MEDKCSKCGGAGWCWWDELDSYAGHDPTSLVVDDTKYSCDQCNGIDWNKKEAEEKSETGQIEPCPFCGSECDVHLGQDIRFPRVVCSQCPYISSSWDKRTPQQAITAHNKVAGRNRVFDQLRDTLSELKYLMDAVLEGEYTPDSVTCQPARIALAFAKELEE